MSIPSFTFLVYAPENPISKIGQGYERCIASDAETPEPSLDIDSDNFFDLEEQPKRVAVIGPGHIVVELADGGGRTFRYGRDGGYFLNGATL